LGVSIEPIVIKPILSESSRGMEPIMLHVDFKRPIVERKGSLHHTLRIEKIERRNKGK
jgi:hypothetical protein